MDRAFELPIHISYRPPIWLIVTITLSHLGAIICIFTVSVPHWLRDIVVITVIAAFLWQLSRNLYCRYRTDPVRLILNSSDEWTLIDDRGDRTLKLLPGTFVHPRLLVLRFRDERRNRSFILSPSVLDRDVLRRLRVRLRLGNVRGEG